MNRVGEQDAAVIARALEAAEVAAQNLHPPKLARLNRLAQPLRGWVEAKDLTTKDEVRLPSKPAAVQEIGEPQDARFFQLLGLFLSSENNTSNALRLDKCLANVSTADEFAQYVTNTWGDRAYADDYVNQLMIDGEPVNAGLSASADSAPHSSESEDSTASSAWTRERRTRTSG